MAGNSQQPHLLNVAYDYRQAAGDSLHRADLQ